MPVEFWSVVIGTVLGFVLSGALSLWLHHRQRKDADQDWHRNNQRDIDWKAQDFVIEVQAFSNNPTIEVIDHWNDPMLRKPTTTSNRRRFNQAKCIELVARANAFEARVADPELKHHIQELNTELLVASHRRSVDDQRRNSVHAHCQKFYYRIAKLYGGPTQQVPAMQEQQPNIEYRTAAVEPTKGPATSAVEEQGG